MYANTNDAMAEGVEGAIAVCPIISEKYQGSVSCKKELSYAEKQGVCIVPIKCEVFEPSGWLGMITSSLLWIAVQSQMTEEQFNASMNGLKNNLQSTEAAKGFGKATRVRRLSFNKRNLEAEVETMTLSDWLMHKIHVAKTVIPEYLESFKKQLAIEEMAGIFGLTKQDLIDSGIKSNHVRLMVEWIDKEKSGEGEDEKEEAAPEYSTTEEEAGIKISTREIYYKKSTTQADVQGLVQMAKRRVLEAVVHLSSTIRPESLPEIKFDENPTKKLEQKPFLYSDDGQVLMRIHVTTSTQTKGLLRRQYCVEAIGIIHCCEAISDEGKKTLQSISDMEGDIQDIRFDKLLKELVLPELSKLMVVLNDASFRSKAKRFEKTNTKPFNSIDVDHQDVLDTVTFHPGGSKAFDENIIYRLHPNEALRLYIPIDAFDRVIFEAKRAEFVTIARELCAKIITTEDNDNSSASKSLEASLELPAAVDVGGRMASTNSNSKDAVLHQIFPKPERFKPVFNKKGKHFYKMEDTWKTMIEAQKSRDNKLDIYEIDFNYTADSTEMASAALSVLAPGNAVGLSADRATTTQTSVKATVKVDFWTRAEVEAQDAPGSPIAQVGGGLAGGTRPNMPSPLNSPLAAAATRA